MKSSFEVQVECYAGYKADEKPRRFCFGERQYDVEAILDQWYGPEDTWFRVRADDGNIYILRHVERGQHDVWTLESFRSTQKGEV